MVYVSNAWTDDRVERLKEMWAAGDTCASIAKAISALPGPSVSRNAVIGKVHRIHLPGRVAASDPKIAGVFKPQKSVYKNRTSGAQNRARTNGQTAQAKAFPGAAKHASAMPPRMGDPDGLPEVEAMPPSPPEAVSGNACRMMDLQPGRAQCRWPINDPGLGRMDETLFCADPVEGDGRAYCAHHHAKGLSPAAYQPRGGAKALEKALRWYAAA